MSKNNFTRADVVSLLASLLEMPDKLIDAVSNENTDWDAEALVDLAIVATPNLSKELSIVAAYRKWCEENPDEGYQYDMVHEFLADFGRGDIQELLESQL